MNRVLHWLQQPTSVAGISALIGTLSALALHQLDLAHAAPLLAGAIVSIVLPDNAGARSAAETLAQEFVLATLQQQVKQ